MAPTYYDKVPSHDHQSNDYDDDDDDPTPPRRPQSSLYTYWLICLALITSLLVNVYLWIGTKTPDIPGNPIFSPANSVLEYENVVTNSGLGPDISAYQGPPTPEREELWHDLYNFGMSRIPIEDAAKLANRTVPIANDPGYYAVTLDVFHQLHCLNYIRRRLYSYSDDNYSSINDGNLTEHDALKHWEHCIDSIRQTLMCSADITPLGWNWNQTAQQDVVAWNVIKQCRKFSNIQEWGRRHQASAFDKSIYVEDPLGNMVVG